MRKTTLQFIFELLHGSDAGKSVAKHKLGAMDDVRAAQLLTRAPVHDRKRHRRLGHIVDVIPEVRGDSGGGLGALLGLDSGYHEASDAERVETLLQIGTGERVARVLHDQGL